MMLRESLATLTGVWLLPVTLAVSPTQGRQHECGERIRLAENACTVGGRVCISSVPDGYIVDEDCCDELYYVHDFFQEPKIWYETASPCETYMLMILDIDSPLKQLSDKNLYINHLIIGNIPVKDLKCGNFSNSTKIAGYMSPTPLPNEEFHHYQLFVFDYADPCSRTYTTVDTSMQFLFDFPKYMEDLKLEGVVLCGPKAAVQFRLNFLNLRQVTDTIIGILF